MFKWATSNAICMLEGGVYSRIHLGEPEGKQNEPTSIVAIFSAPDLRITFDAFRLFRTRKIHHLVQRKRSSAITKAMLPTGAGAKLRQVKDSLSGNQETYEYESRALILYTSTSFPAAPRRPLFAPLDSLDSLHVLLPAFRFGE